MFLSFDASLHKHIGMNHSLGWGRENKEDDPILGHPALKWRAMSPPLSKAFEIFIWRWHQTVLRNLFRQDGAPTDGARGQVQVSFMQCKRLSHWTISWALRLISSCSLQLECHKFSSKQVAWWKSACVIFSYNCNLNTRVIWFSLEP